MGWYFVCARARLSHNMRLKIRYKMFLAILVANALLLLVVYFSANWIFNTSFRDYLDQSEADRLQPLVQELSVHYRQHGNWRWVRDRGNRSWPELMREYGVRRPRPGSERLPPPGTGFDRDRPPPPGEDFGSNRPPPPGEGFDSDRPPPGAREVALAIHPDILLRNAAGRLVIGNPRRQQDAYWIPIESEAVVVGYLGFVRRLNIDGKLDRLFADRVENYLSWLLLGVLLITGLVAIPLAAGLVRPVERLRLALRELASGNFDLSLDRHGNDEIGDLQRDFNRLAQTMQKNLQARQRWIADISHELRTPVAVLQGELEAILDDVRQLDKASIRSLHQEVLRLSRLVNDLHELSLSDLGAMSYHNREIDLGLLLGSIVEQQAQLQENEGLSFELLAQGGATMVFADEHRLEQLFSNLAHNSRQYTSHPGQVQVTLRRSAGNAVIDWSDSAPGVGDADLERLFDRLYRVDASRARNTGGSGLGLSICRNIVEASQGSIHARHSPLGGVTLHISLPLLEGADD
jgi:two-component system sensor histidine kinase BaeS